MMSSKLVPKLRFKEFSGEWEEKSFQDLTKINQGLQISISKRYTEKVENSYFYITNEFLKKDSQKQYFIKNPPKSVLCTEKDILMTRTGNTGQIVTNVNGAFHNNFFKIEYNEKLNKDFLVYFLKSVKTQNIIMSLAGSSTIPDLNHTSFYKMIMQFPSLKEQQKIANTLSSLDNLIEANSKKVEALKEHKKGLMQQLFPTDDEKVPKLRFKEFSGEWEETIIGNIGKFHYGKSAPKWSLEDNAPTKCVRYGELYTRFGVMITETYSRTNIDPEKLRFSKGGEILVPRVGERPEEFGKCCSYLPLKDIAIGEMISVFETKENSLFYTYYFRNLWLEFSKVVEGQNVKNLYYKELEPLKIHRPNQREQQKIANTLFSLDNLIESQSKKIEALKEHKKGLMQQMFVNEELEDE